MKRIFQNNKGRIPELEGNHIINAKLLVNQEDSSIVILWLCLSKNEIWYRIFIDGFYCGIDELQIDESHNDLDDGIRVEDVSAWFKNIVFQSVLVEDRPSENQLCLTFQASLISLQLVYDTISDQCQFKRIKRENAF